MTYKDFKLLTKMRLSMTVVYSSLISFILASQKVGNFDWLDFGILFLGGFFITGAANAYNQVLEKDKDFLMDRTKNRPLPQNRMTLVEGILTASLLTISGLLLLYMLNIKAAFFGALSLLIYVFVYTPFKSISPLAVFIGAFPGAIPFMLGWVAVYGQFGIETGWLFLFQFVWQFPHFWAIAWMSDSDYKKAGFELLPTRHPDKNSARQILFYSLFMLCVSIMPYFGLVGDIKLGYISLALFLLLGFLLCTFAFRLYRSLSKKDAQVLLVYCVVYLPVTQAIMVLDKYMI